MHSLNPQRLINCDARCVTAIILPRIILIATSILTQARTITLVLSQSKKPFKGKGKQQANTAEQVTSIVMIDSDDEDDTGHTSQTAEIGWSVVTPSIHTAESSSLLHDDYM